MFGLIVLPHLPHQRQDTRYGAGRAFINSFQHRSKCILCASLLVKAQPGRAKTSGIDAPQFTPCHHKLHKPKSQFSRQFLSCCAQSLHASRRTFIKYQSAGADAHTWDIRTAPARSKAIQDRLIHADVDSIASTPRQFARTNNAPKADVSTRPLFRSSHAAQSRQHRRTARARTAPGA